MKTARITLLVEYDDQAPTGAFFNSPALDGEHAAAMDIVPVPRRAGLHIMYGAQIIGTPRVELDTRPRCSMSEAQFQYALRGIQERGGIFAKALANALGCAGSGNLEKLAGEFHDLLWSYISEEVPA